MSDKQKPEPGTMITRYVDRAMFEAEDFSKDALKRPRVYLLSATPDPLGAITAAMMMYEGRVIRDLSELTNEERKHYYDDCFNTALRAPFEFVDFHFMVEGVTRAHTHQEVRQRTAVFAQESMRFAVKEKIVARPGPLTQRDPDAHEVWDTTMDFLWDKYLWLVENGIPAEEARGILPHDTLTRLHHKVNLRNLIDELGKRTCTQAQFEWRLWATAVRQAIRDYGGGFVPYPDTVRTERMDWETPISTSPVFGEEGPFTAEEPKPVRIHHDDAQGYYTGWQFRYIADSPIFQPVCFNTGRCMFKSGQDRGCTIRERVEAGKFDEIKTEEWLLDPTAGWVR